MLPSASGTYEVTCVETWGRELPAPTPSWVPSAPRAPCPRRWSAPRGAERQPLCARAAPAQLHPRPQLPGVPVQPCRAPEPWLSPCKSCTVALEATSPSIFSSRRSWKMSSPDVWTSVARGLPRPPGSLK